MRWRWQHGVAQGAQIKPVAVGLYLGCAGLLLAATGLALDRLAGAARASGEAVLEAYDVLSPRHDVGALRLEAAIQPAPLTMPHISHASARVAAAISTPVVALSPLRNQAHGLGLAASSAHSKVERADSVAWHSGEGQTFQTMCVRLCDGAYWPVSFSTSPDNFEHDEGQCRSSCAAPTRLYHFSNPDGAPETMEDANGRAYSRLKTAFLFQARRDPACACKPEPWSLEALAQHRVMALQAQLASQRQGKSKATAALTAPQIAAVQQELAGLQSKISAAKLSLVAVDGPNSGLDDEPKEAPSKPRRQSEARAQPTSGGATYMGLGLSPSARGPERPGSRVAPPLVTPVAKSSDPGGWQRRVFESPK